MRRCLRRIAAMALALLLTLPPLPEPAGAPGGDVYLVAVNIEILEVKQETMPFWSGGHLYVSSEVFSGDNRSALGVAFSRPPNKPVVLYSLRSIGVALFFDLETGQSYDGQNNAYHLPAIERGSYVFFPIDLVASVLGLTYSYTPASPAPLIRIKDPSVSQLSDAVYLDAAATQMHARYNSYINSLPATQTPDTGAVPVYTGQRVYLIFTLSDPSTVQNTLDILSRQGAQATFLLTPGQIEENGDLVRSLTATGQGVGLLVGGGDPVAEAERGNDLLWRSARARTRLVWPEGGRGGDAEALRAAGYCVMEGRVEARPLTGSGRAEQLYQQIAGLMGRDQTVFLGDTAENLSGLGTLLTRLKGNQCRVIAYRETV